MTCPQCVKSVEIELQDANFNNYDVEIGTTKVEHITSEDAAKIVYAIEEGRFKIVN